MGRQNENTIVAPPSSVVQVDSSSETSNSDNTVPTTCAGVLTLMDKITDTLKTNPAGVTPLITALSAIEKPLATPCSAEDIKTLTTKINTAKSTADTAVREQTKLKAAATEKYNIANDKVISLNEQIAAQGGSTIAAGSAAPTVAAGADSSATTAAGADSGATTAAGADSDATTAAGSAAAGGKVCDFPKDVTGQLYTIPDIKTNEAGTLKFVFEKPKAGSISMKIVDQPGIIWLCSDSSSSSSSSSSSGSATGEHQCVSLNSVPAGTYIVEVSSGVATAKDFTPWTTPPLLTTFYVGEIDYCTTTA